MRTYDNVKVKDDLNSKTSQIVNLKANSLISSNVSLSNGTFTNLITNRLLRPTYYQSISTNANVVVTDAVGVYYLVYNSGATSNNIVLPGTSTSNVGDVIYFNIYVDSAKSDATDITFTRADSTVSIQGVFDTTISTGTTYDVITDTTPFVYPKIYVGISTLYFDGVNYVWKIQKLTSLNLP